MIEKQHRFSGPNSTRHVQKNGRSVRQGAFSLRYLATNRSSSRLAVVVSKKVDKRAVVRNRIRRRVFEILRAEWPLIKHPVDMTIGVFSSTVATEDRDVLQGELRSLLLAAQIIETPEKH